MEKKLSWNLTWHIAAACFTGGIAASCAILGYWIAAAGATIFCTINILLIMIVMRVNNESVDPDPSWLVTGVNKTDPHDFDINC